MLTETPQDLAAVAATTKRHVNIHPIRADLESVDALLQKNRGVVDGLWIHHGKSS